MRISIAIATYNGERYVQEQLESLAAQTLLPDEVVVADDCSSDNTITIVKEFSEKSPFKVKYFVNKVNLGYTGNFNAELMQTTGDLVFLCDQDDVWFPNKLEHIYTLAVENPEALVIMNDAELTDGELNSVGLTKIGQIKSAGLNMSSFVMGCTSAIKRELLDICLPIPEGLRGHDNWLVEIAAALDGKLIDEIVLQYYRRHETNESQSITNRTTKVTKFDVIKSRLNKAFNSNDLEVKKALKNNKLYIDGLKECLGKLDGVWLGKLKKYIDDVETKDKVLQERILIRSYSLLQRIKAVIKFYKAGGYQNTSGFQAILRDVVGV